MELYFDGVSTVSEAQSSTMNLLDLPVEVLGEIVKHLDANSKLVVWTISESVRVALRRRIIMRRVQLVGGSEVLRSAAFMDLAPYIEELDIRGLDTLSAHSLRPISPLLCNLREIDLTHTRVHMLEASELCEACPNLRSLAVFFNWPDVFKYGTLEAELDCQKLIERCQRAFAVLEAVRFVGDCNEMLNCQHPFVILRLNDRVRSLILDCVEETNAMHIHYDCLLYGDRTVGVPPSLRTFAIRYQDDNIRNFEIFGHIITRLFDLSNWHVLMVESSNYIQYMMGTLRFYLSHQLLAVAQELIANEDSNIQEFKDSCHLFNRNCNGSYVFMWHKELEKHNPRLLLDIITRIRIRFPIVISKTSPLISCKKPLIVDNNHSRTFLLKLINDLVPPGDIFEPPTKRACRNLHCYDVDIDKVTNSTIGARVSIVMDQCRPCYPRFSLRFNLGATSLRNLTYLSIIECILDSASEALFETCLNLQTLKLLGSERYHMYGWVSRAHMSHTLKNLMYMDAFVDIADLLRTLSRCSTLENVSLSQITYNFCYQPNVDDFHNFFIGCPKLYSLVMKDCSMNRSLNSTIKKAVNQLQRNIHVATDCFPYERMINTEPFSEVFNFFNVNNFFDHMTLKYQ